MSDQVVTTIQIPDWAYKVLGEQIEDIIDEDFDVDLTEDKPNECYHDPAYGKVWTLITVNAPQGNAPVEGLLRQYCVPYDKWFDAGIQVEAGREWYRYDEDGKETKREVYDGDHPNYEEMFAARDRRITRALNGDETFANKRFVSFLRSWWDDHKPLEPELSKCRPNKKFLELSKVEA